MQEFLGLAYFAEVPSVIFDVQRGGPSTGMPTRTQQSDILRRLRVPRRHQARSALPEDPRECFEFGALAFDLADRLQTPIFVMLDLDMGMNEWLCEPLSWDDGRRFDRGKVLTSEELEAGREFGRYLDTDGDGVPFRTYPGTHPTKGAFFTRHLTGPLCPLYRGPVYVDNMQRLLRKFETAKSLVPKPIRKNAGARPVSARSISGRRLGDARGHRDAAGEGDRSRPPARTSASRSPTR